MTRTTTKQIRYLVESRGLPFAVETDPAEVVRKTRGLVEARGDECLQYLTVNVVRLGEGAETVTMAAFLAEHDR